ncbi:MAG: hypothetical protein ACI4JY_10580, partial [Oscillospiraceae bacterium]
VKRIIAAVVSMAVVFSLFVFFPVKAQASSYCEISLDDLDDCLTSYEELELKEIMQKTADKINCNVGIVITADLEGYMSKNYADDYSEDKFGYGSDSVVLLLLNRHDNPEYKNDTIYCDWISTDGRAKNLYDNHINGIFKKTYRGLDNTFIGSEPEHKKDVYTSTNYGTDYVTQDSIQFFMAGKYFCKALTTYKNPFTRFFDNAIQLAASNFMFTLVVFVITIVVTVSAVKTTVRMYKKKAPLSAAKYIDKNHFVVKRQVDQFVREYTTSVTVSSSSGGRSGGGGGGGHGGGGGRGR